MGYFSKCCAKSHLPVLVATWQKDIPRLATVVILAQDPECGTTPGTYEGYGFENYETAKFVLADAYQGESWASLPESAGCPRQGFFYSKGFLQGLAQVPKLSGPDQLWDLVTQYEASEETRCRDVLGINQLWPGRVWEFLSILNCASESWRYTQAGYKPKHNDWLVKHGAKLAEYPKLADWMPDSIEDQSVLNQKVVTAITEANRRYTLDLCRQKGIPV